MCSSDLLGGVQVEVGSTFEESGVLFTPGERRLDGEQALAYVRMRKHDPRGDLGRNGRQQQVLRSLLGGLMTLEPARLPGLIRDVYTEVRTDLTVPELLTLRQDWRIGDTAHAAGSLLIGDAQAVLRGERQFQPLFKPSGTRSLAGYGLTRSRVLLNISDKVAKIGRAHV